MPTLVLDGGYAVYGPVVVPAPGATTRSRSGTSCAPCTRFPQLYELRHPKTRDDLVSIGEHFRTYLTTRDWHTVENPAP